MKKIKVAQFVGSMNCGGTETMLMKLFSEIDKKKYEFFFIENIKEKSWYTDEIIKLGGKVVKVPQFRFINIIKYFCYLVRLFKKEKFDVVHSHVFLHSGIVMAAAKIANVPIRISHSHSAMRSSDNNFFKVFLLRWLILRNSTRILACSTEAGMCLYGKSFKKKGKVVPNPIELKKINNISEDIVNILRKKYCLSDDVFVIGHVGRLVEVKNHKFILEIAKGLKKRNFNFKLFFLGDGPLKDDLMETIDMYDLNNEVIMTGNVPNNTVYEYMKFFDILLLPSYYEGLPVTLIDAQATGLYSLVSTNVSRESDLGLNLMKFQDIDDINPWIDFIINFNKQFLSKEFINKKIMEKKYSLDVSVKEYEKLYSGK